jgi:hypothetical protein
MTSSLYATRERRARIRDALTAIADGLTEYYFPALSERLPRELTVLVARLAVLESARKRSFETPVEPLPLALAPLRPQR